MGGGEHRASVPDKDEKPSAEAWEEANSKGCCMCKPSPVTDGPKPLNKRGCTDLLCLLIFVVFLGVLLFIMIYAAVAGDASAYWYGTDYLGNRCGVGTYKELKKTFYPRIALDLVEQSHLLYTKPWKMNLYGLCVAACPLQFDIVNPIFIHDYGYSANSSTTIAFGTGTQQEWVSALSTTDMLNRCIPRTASNIDSDASCAYPACDSSQLNGLNVTCSTTHPGEWTVCAAGSTDCARQKQLCKVQAEHMEGVAYTAYTADEGSSAVLVTIADKVGGVYEFADAIAQAYGYIALGGVVVPILLAFVVMILLRFFAKIVVYTMLFLLQVAIWSITILCYFKAGLSYGGVDANSLLADRHQNITFVQDITGLHIMEVSNGNQWIWTCAFWVMLIISSIALLLLAMSRKKIKIAIAILTESCRVFGSMPSLLITPSWTVLAQACIFAWSIAVLALLLTTKPQSYAEFRGFSEAAGMPDAVDGLAALRLGQTEGVTGFLVFVQIFGFLWLVQFSSAVGWTTMSGAVCHWYFFRNDEEHKTRIPILRSACRVWRYHIGSMAFGSFAVALCQMMRIALAYVDKQFQSAQNASLILKLVFKCCSCCLWCLEKTVRFITYYGYVFVALRGESFCSACWATFSFIVSNPAQVAMNAVVVKLVSLMCLITIPVLCSICTYVYCEQSANMRNPSYPTVVTFIFAVCVVKACMSVFECTVTTIFICAFRDARYYKGKHMSKSLRVAFDIPAPAGDGGGGGAGVEASVVKGKPVPAEEEEEEEEDDDDAYGAKGVKTVGNGRTQKV